MSKETSCSPGSSEKGDTSTCEPDPEDFISISVTSQLLQDPYYISLVGDFIIWETEKYLKIVKQLDENETVSEHVVPQLDMDPNISESFIRGLPQVIQQWRVLYALHGRMLTIRLCPFELHELVWVAFPVHIAFWFKTPPPPSDVSMVDFYAGAYVRWYYGYPIRPDGTFPPSIRVVSPPVYLCHPDLKNDLTPIMIDIGHKHEIYQVLKDAVDMQTFAATTSYRYAIGIKIYSKSFQVFYATRDKKRGFGMAPLEGKTGYESPIIDVESPTDIIIELPALEIYKGCRNLPPIPSKTFQLPLECIRRLFQGKL